MSGKTFTLKEAHAAVYGVALCLKALPIPESMKMPGQVALGHQAHSVDWNNLSDAEQIASGLLLPHFRLGNVAPFTATVQEDGKDGLKLMCPEDDIVLLATALMAIISLAAGSETWEDLFDALSPAAQRRGKDMLTAARFIPLH